MNNPASFKVKILCLIAWMWLFVNIPKAIANEENITVKLSTGISTQKRNNVQIPNDTTGDRFSLVDIAGEGPLQSLRLEAIWALSTKHQLRLLLAPLSYTETGVIDEPIRFSGATFSDAAPLEATYRFNSWRLGYRYHWKSRDYWDLWVGGTLKVRDAEIKLAQSGVVAIDDDLGIVPLLHLAGERRFTNRLSATFDLDALGGGPGRAIDIGIGVGFRISQTWKIGLELRALEGGADIDEVYNFAWFNSALVTIEFSK